mgnify:CR=1 FL=1
MAMEKTFNAAEAEESAKGAGSKKGVSTPESPAIP